MIQELKNITVRQSIIALFVFLGSISPGALIIFYFDRELFLALDGFKLMVLSLSITLPVVLLNLIFASVYTESEELSNKLKGSDVYDEERAVKSDSEMKQDDLLAQMMVAFWISAVILYIALALAYWNKSSLTAFSVYVLIGLVLSFLTTFGTHLSNRKKRKKLSELDNENELEVAG